MFVLLGLLVWPQRMADSLFGSVIVALTLMLVARPVSVFLCLAPFGFQWREKLFVSWVGLRGAVAIFLASIPLLVGLPTAYLFFDVAFVVVAVVAVDPGLDRRRCRAQARHGVRAQRSAAAPRRTRSARAADARDRRLSGAGQQPVPAPRADPELGAADAGRAQRGDPDADRGASGAPGRLRLSAGAAGKGAGARPLLRQHAAAGRARSAAARRFLRVRRGGARRLGRHLRPAGRRRPRRRQARRLLYRESRPPGQDRRYRATRPDRAVGARSRQRPRRHGRLAARRNRRGARFCRAPQIATGSEFRLISASARAAPAPGRAAPARRRRTAPRSRTGRPSRSCRGTAAPRRSIARGPGPSSDTCR